MIICIIFYQITKIIVKQKIPEIIERIDLDGKPGFWLTKLNFLRNPCHFLFCEGVEVKSPRTTRQ